MNTNALGHVHPQQGLHAILEASTRQNVARPHSEEDDGVISICKILAEHVREHSNSLL